MTLTDGELGAALVIKPVVLPIDLCRLKSRAGSLPHSILKETARSRLAVFSEQPGARNRHFPLAFHPFA